MKKVFQVGFVLFGAGIVCGYCQTGATGKDVRKTVPVHLRFVKGISSANAKAGQEVSLETAEPVVVDGNLLIPVGAEAHAVVTNVVRRGRNEREGSLAIAVQSVHSSSGDLHVVSKEVAKGSGHGNPVFGPCTFPFPADPAGLFRKGKDVEIPAGTIVSAELLVP